MFRSPPPRGATLVMSTAVLHCSKMKEGSAEEAVASYSHPCVCPFRVWISDFFLAACLSDFPPPSANITSEEKTVRDKEFRGGSEVAEALKEKKPARRTRKRCI